MVETQDASQGVIGALRCWLRIMDLACAIA
jgi:hypothetical protein